jgi:hypothetical protein
LIVRAEVRCTTGGQPKRPSTSRGELAPIPTVQGQQRTASHQLKPLTSHSPTHFRTRLPDGGPTLRPLHESKACLGNEHARDQNGGEAAFFRQPSLATGGLAHMGVWVTNRPATPGHPHTTTKSPIGEQPDTANIPESNRRCFSSQWESQCCCAVWLCGAHSWCSLAAIFRASVLVLGARGWTLAARCEMRNAFGFR